MRPKIGELSTGTVGFSGKKIFLSGNKLTQEKTKSSQAQLVILLKEFFLYRSDHPEL
jgi:hypothetical protein